MPFSKTDKEKTFSTDNLQTSILRVGAIAMRTGDSTPTMDGKISTTASGNFFRNDRVETFVPDTGCTICVIPHQIVNDYNIKLEAVDENEPQNNASGDVMEVLGRATFFAYFSYFPTPKRVRGVVVNNSPDRDILLD